MSISILKESDYTEWADQWKQYLAFYKTELPESQYKNTFSRLIAENGDLSGFVIRHEEGGKIVGLAHYFTHQNAWTDKPVCYLNGKSSSPHVDSRSSRTSHTHTNSPVSSWPNMTRHNTVSNYIDAPSNHYRSLRRLLHKGKGLWSKTHYGNVRRRWEIRLYKSLLDNSTYQYYREKIIRYTRDHGVHLLPDGAVWYEQLKLFTRREVSLSWWRFELCG